MNSKNRIGVVAPSSAVPAIELKLARQRLLEEGFSVRVHPQCTKRNLFFAGSDVERANAFADFAYDSTVDVIWCARGGHGALRILPLLEKLTQERGKPGHKLLVGYSDATALMEFARKRWGWATLHGPMLALKEFSCLPSKDWKPLTALVKGERAVLPFESRKLKYFGETPAQSIQAELVGGNLAVWCSLVGTSFAGIAENRILFFEDVGEALYRVDRMVRQIELSGGFLGVRAIVLGTFENCDDSAPPVLKKYPRLKKGRPVEKTLRNPPSSALKPLRPTISRIQGLRGIFGELGARLSIPVAYGLPVGHGPEYPPLPLGAIYELDPKGSIRLAEWSSWLDSRGPLR